MDRKKIRKSLNTYITVIKKLFNPEQVILYGSYARNEANEWSDVDLLILADFKKTNFNERLKKIDKATSDICSDKIFDIRGLTLSEYNSAKPWTIYEEIKREGIVLFQK